MISIEEKGNSIIKQGDGSFISGILINREKNSLRYLQKFDFVPRLVNSSQKTLKSEKINGDFIHHLSNPDISIVKSLKHALDSMHKEWIFHLDLRQRKNIIITPDNKVYLIDFESCIRLPVCGILRPLAEFLRAIDYAGLLRIKARYFPASITRREVKFMRIFNILRQIWIIRPFKKRKGDAI